MTVEAVHDAPSRAPSEVSGRFGRDGVGGLRRLAVALLPFVLLQNYVVGWLLHFLHGTGANRAEALSAAGALGGHDAGGHSGHHRPMPVSAWDQLTHYLRDSTVALPAGFAVLLLAAVGCRWLLRRRRVGADTALARFAFAITAAVAIALASVPSVLAHGWLFDERLPVTLSMGEHLVEVAALSLRYTFVIALGYVVLFGVPWHRLDRPTPGAPAPWVRSED